LPGSAPSGGGQESVVIAWLLLCWNPYPRTLCRERPPGIDCFARSFPLARGLPGEPGTLHVHPASLSSRYPLIKALNYSPTFLRRAKGKAGYPTAPAEGSRLHHWLCPSLSLSVHSNEVGYLTWSPFHLQRRLSTPPALYLVTRHLPSATWGIFAPFPLHQWFMQGGICVAYITTTRIRGGSEAALGR
jgi:hypothetical protein